MEPTTVVKATSPTDEEKKEEVKNITKPEQIKATASDEKTFEVLRDPSTAVAAGQIERYLKNVAVPNSNIETTTITVSESQRVELPIMSKMPSSWDYKVVHFKNGVKPQITLMPNMKLLGNLANPREFRLIMDALIDQITKKFMGIFQDVKTKEIEWLGTRFVDPVNYSNDIISRLRTELSVADFDEDDFDQVRTFYELGRRHVTDIDPDVDFSKFMKQFFFFAFSDDIQLQQDLQSLYLEHYTLPNGINRARTVINRLFSNKYRMMEPLPYDLELESIRVLWHKPLDHLSSMLENRKNEVLRNIFINFVLRTVQSYHLLPFMDMTKVLQELVSEMNTSLTKVTKKNVVIGAFSGMRGKEMADMISLWQCAPKFVELEFPHNIQSCNDATAIADALLWALILPAECMTAQSRRVIRAIIAIGLIFELKRDYFNPGQRSRAELIRVYEDTERDVLAEVMPMLRGGDGRGRDGESKSDVVAGIAAAFSVFDHRQDGGGFFKNDPDVVMVTSDGDKEIFGAHAGFAPLWGNPAFGDDVPELALRIERFSALFDLDKKPVKESPSNVSLWEVLFAMFRALSFKARELSLMSWAMNEMARSSCLIMSFPASRQEQMASVSRKVHNVSALGLWSMILMSDVSRLNPTITLPVHNVINTRTAIDRTMTSLVHYYTVYFDVARYPDSWLTKRERWDLVFKALKQQPSTFDATPATSLADVFKTMIVDRANLETFIMPKELYPFEVKVRERIEKWIEPKMKSWSVVSKVYYCPNSAPMAETRLFRGGYVLNPEMKIGFTYTYDTLTRDVISDRGAFRRRLIAARNAEVPYAIEFNMRVPVQMVEYDGSLEDEEFFHIEGSSPAKLVVGPLKFYVKRPGSRDDIYNTTLKSVLRPQYVIAAEDIDAVEMDVPVKKILPMIGGEVLAFKKSATFVGPSDIPKFTKFISVSV